MKKTAFRKTFLQLVSSVIVLGVFILLAVGSGEIIDPFELGENLGPMKVTYTTDPLPNGDLLIKANYSDGHYIEEIGQRNERGQADGLVTREHYDRWGKLISRETCTFKNSWRNGVSTITFFSTGEVKTRCYKMGEKVDCDKKAAWITEEQSAYDLLIENYPWYGFLLNSFDFDDTYLKSFMDTLEIILFAYEAADTLNEDGFTDYYNDAISDLGKTPYDSIIQINGEHILFHGLDLIKHNEFRLITFDRYWSEDKDTYKIVKNKYPNYLLLITAGEMEITDDDFKGFCEQYDSLLNSYGILDPNDDYFVDSVDFRMYRAFSEITSDDSDSTSSNVETSSMLLKSLEMDIIPGTKLKLSSLNKLAFAVNKTSLSQTSANVEPADVATMVVLMMIIEIIKADLVLNATEEAYNLKKGVVMGATVVTEFVGNNSATSATIAGDVLKDGGGDVIERGIVWSQGYNPNLDNDVVSSGSGIGIYEVNILGLTEGETYFARAFATNSAGTAYGNNIEFVAQSNVGINKVDKNQMEFKIYPNPASEHITFLFNTETQEKMVLILININGQVVLEKTLIYLSQGENKVELNVSGLENGIYNCRLMNNNNEKASLKFVIAH